MEKTRAIDLLGGSVSSAAACIGITSSAVSQWSDPLPQRIVDRVQAALWRIKNKIPHPTIATDDVEPETAKA